MTLAAPLGLDGYVAIVDAGSIAEAARALGVPRATLSRQLQRLEQELDTRLLHRSTRRLVLTVAGEELYRRGRHIVAETRAAEEAIRHLDGAPRGLLRISTPGMGPGGVLGEPIAAFLTRFPEVRIEVIATNRHVDLVAEGIDVALRGGVVRDPNLVRRVLLRTDLWAVASPLYLERRGTPVSPEELIDHACLVGFAGTAHPQTTWPLLEGGEVRVQPTHASDDPFLLRTLACHHHGIALTPSTLLLDDVVSGRLIRVLPDHVGQRAGLSIVYAHHEIIPHRVRAFVDHLVAWVRDHPTSFGGGSPP
jgi:DNA-binding transcriptional LysR family regulator